MSSNIQKEKEDPEVISKNEEFNRKASYQNRAQILIVDDDLDFLELLSKSLAAEFDVLITNDGKKGLQIFKERSPDLIITDIFMPKLNGIELTHEISRYSHTPVIVLSGYTKELSELEKTILSQESIFLIQKPIKIKDLYRKIKEVLRIN